MSVYPTNVLTQVSLGSLTNIWGVDVTYRIYQYNGSAWTRIAGALKQVSAAPDGTVWGVGPDNTVYNYAGNNTWTKMPGTLKQVSVGSSSSVWGVNPSNQCFIYDGGTWVQVADGTIKEICADRKQGPPMAATAWGLTSQGGVSQCFYYNRKATWNGISTGSPQLVSLSSIYKSSLFVTDSAGVVYQYINDATGLVNLGLPLARSCAFTDDLKSYVLIDVQGKTQQNPQSAGWNTAVEDAVSTRYFKLVNRKSGKVLDVKDASMNDGANVQQFIYGSGLNQQWSLELLTENYYKIVNRNSGNVLDVNAYSMENGANVQQWSDNGGMNQQWSFVPTTENYYKIVNRNSGNVLDVDNASMNDGANVQQWGSNSGLGQQWSLEVIS